MRRLRSAPLLLLALTAPLAAQVAPPRAGQEDPDDPGGRAAWNLTWFGEVTPQYLAFKNAAAAREVARWPRSFPGPRNPQTLRPLPAAGPGGAAWTNLGPTGSTSFPDTDSGRPVAIVVDPTDAKTIYLATSGGGVWKSTQADTASTAAWTWTPITDGLPASSATGNVSCGALAMSPADHLTLYLALGDAFDATGTGVYKTTDGGAHWTAATITGATPTRSYQILAVDANTVLVGTNKGLLRSTDGGATFSKVGQPAGSIWTVQAFDATHLVCSSEGTDQGIWYSSNAGQTWTAASASYQSGSAPGRITLATTPASATQAWGIYEDRNSGTLARGLLKTTDAGHTWTFVAAPTASGGLFQGTGPQMSGDGGQAFYNHGLAVDPTNANRVFVGANLALYRTEDGGASWTQLSHWYGSGHPYAHADFHCTAWNGAGTALYVGNDGGLAVFRDPFRATIPTADDSSFVYNGWNQGLVTHLCYNLGSTQATNAADAKDRISLGMQDNGTRIRVKGGAASLGASGTFDDHIGGDGFGTVWNPADANQVLGSLYYTAIFRSTNGGASFNESDAGIAEANDSSLSPFQPVLALGATATPNTVYTATNGKVYKSTDFGATWSALGTTGLPPGGTSSSSDPSNALYIRNVGAAPSDGNTLGLVANQSRVYLSANGGTSWTQGGALSGAGSYLSWISFDPTDPQTVYVASVAPSSTAHHLWKSANGGTSFSAIDGTAAASNGLPFGIPVHVVKNLPGDASTVFAGTDFGVYESTDGGATWSRFGSGLPLVAVRDLYLAPDKTYIRVATFGRGVWQASLGTAPGNITVSPASGTLPVGGTLDFKATSGLTPNTVTWTATAGAFSAGSTPGEGATATTYTAPATIASVSLPVTVTATGSDGTTTGTAAVTVYDPAAVTISVNPSADQTVLAGKTVSFVATTNFGNVSWTSQFGGSFNPTVTPGDGATATAFTTPKVTANAEVIVTAQSVGGAGRAVHVHVKTLDINADGATDARDLLALMRLYGKTDATSLAAGDLDGDGAIGDADLTLFLANF